jgi:hypothetical protein
VRGPGRVAGAERRLQDAARQALVDDRAPAERQAVAALGDLQHLLRALQRERARQVRRRRPAYDTDSLPPLRGVVINCWPAPMAKRRFLALYLECCRELGFDPEPFEA